MVAQPQTRPTITTNRPTIEVHERDRERWQAALDRWTTRLAHRAEPLFAFRPASIEGGTCRSYEVASYSQPGTTHLVELFLTADGLYAACDCTAGELAVICQHAAGAIDAAGWWPFEVARQVELADLPVSQAPPALFRLGQPVRYARRRKTIFTIVGMQYTPGQGWMCQIETLDGVLWPRLVSELELAPHTNRKRRAA